MVNLPSVQTHPDKIDLDEIQSKLCDSLSQSGWRGCLKAFILGKDFRNILEYLLRQSQEENHFTPRVRQMLRAFTECPYGELKVVFLGQDPYQYVIDGETVADGLAFSCGNTKKIQPSLKYIFKEVEDQIYPEGGYSWDPDLKRWANQGILLLNSALTTTVGKTGTHYEIWKPFITYVLDYLSWHNPGLIYCFLGKKAMEFSDIVSSNSWKFFLPHPASAAYQNQERWYSKYLFKRINEILKSTNNVEIVW